MKTVITRAGLKCYINGEHVKTVPQRYESIINESHILNHLKKRLTSEERWLLEIELLKYNIKKHHPVIYNLIKKSKPNFTQIIKTKTGNYCELVFKNKVRVKCSQDVHHLSINSKEPIYRNY